jgi:hypothetical protein
LRPSALLRAGFPKLALFELFMAFPDWDEQSPRSRIIRRDGEAKPIFTTETRRRKERLPRIDADKRGLEALEQAAEKVFF